MVLLAVVTVAASCDYADRPVAPPEYNSAAGEGLKGTIAFDSRRDGNTEIYSMNANGTGVTRLTNNVTTDEAPAWSPNGMQIVFDSFRGGSDDIYIMNTDGTGVTRLTNSADAIRPAWSPTCKQIAFASDRDTPPFDEIYVMNADGTGITRLTNNNAANDDNSAWPPWSSDGNQIAFESNRDGNREIYVMNADGTGVTRLTNNVFTDAVPAWTRH